MSQALTFSIPSPSASLDRYIQAVNRFPMPFLISAADAAGRTARAIESGRALVILPWQMRLVFAFLRRAPAWMFDRIFARAPRKPRSEG